MKTQDAINYFGSVAELAKAIGVTVQAVYAWGDTVHPLRQYQIQVLTRNKLKATQKTAA